MKWALPTFMAFVNMLGPVLGSSNPTVSPTSAPTRLLSSAPCSRNLFSSCNILPTNASQFYINETGVIVPLDVTAGPFVIKAFRLELTGDCIYLDAADWPDTYFGDFLSLQPDLSSPASWRGGLFLHILNATSVSLNGWGSTRSIALADNTQLQLCISGQFLALTYPDGASSITISTPIGSVPYFVDVGVEAPGANYTFDFSNTDVSLASNSETILVNKSTQNCTSSSTHIAVLRQEGECASVHLLNSVSNFTSFSLGVYTGPVPITDFSARQCGNYLRQEGIFYSLVSQKVTICPGFGLPYSTVAETYCDLEATGVRVAQVSELRFCKTACGVNLHLEGSRCVFDVMLPSDGDFVLDGVATNLCDAYSLNASDIFTSSCTSYSPIVDPLPQPERSTTSNTPSTMPTSKVPTSKVPTQRQAPTRKPTRYPTLRLLPMTTNYFHLFG